MKKYFAQLRPMERRLVVGVAVIVFLVINWVSVWPHFSDWSNLAARQVVAGQKLKLYQAAVARIPQLQSQVRVFESEGQFVAPEDQGINFMRTIQTQASASGVGIVNFSRSLMSTNQFFMEQVQNITAIGTEEQFVDFLYKIGAGASMIRVRDLEMQPDQPRQRLNANIRLAASYQKNPAPTNAVKTSTAKAK